MVSPPLTCIHPAHARPRSKISNWPPVVAFSCLNAASGPDRLKDTTNNVKNDTSGFVVNILSEPFIEHANATSIDAPPDVDEWTLSGLTKVPSVRACSLPPLSLL